jgi:type III pantothenate kinase
MMFHSFLLIDIGNSRTKWATAPIPGRGLGTTHSRTPVQPMGEMATSEVGVKSVLALREEFQGYFLVFSSVVPAITPLFLRYFKRGVHCVEAGSSPLGFQFDYPNPSELGADRLAAAVAIAAEESRPAIIIACGTATALSVLDAKGKFCGGMIAPGLHAQLTALIQQTSQLPEVSLKMPRSVLARSTTEAIRAGVMVNFQGGVKEMIARLCDAFPGERATIVLTGGDAELAAKSLPMPHTVRPLLVLEGLRIIGHRIWNLESE